MNTNERQLKEIAVALLLFVAVGLCVRCCLSIREEISRRPAIEQLHQTQEMIDYHRQHGRDIITY